MTADAGTHCALVNAAMSMQDEANDCLCVIGDLERHFIKRAAKASPAVGVGATGGTP